LAGMTGTADTEAYEFQEIYGLETVVVPPNKPSQRKDLQDQVYKTSEEKYKAMLNDIADCCQRGQPVLVGTTSIENSELLSGILTKAKLQHNVLNAKQHEREAEIIAQAGRPKQITIATNMAGRGTDIVLGGNVDFLADQRLRRKGLDPVETPEEYEAAWDETLSEIKALAAVEAKEVIEAGGLYVLGTERHESRRIDNQLRGRSGRQGDPGESRFYLSLGDELMRRFNGAALESLLTRLNLPDDVPIEAKMVNRAIKSAQTQVEQQNFEIRKNVLKYDEVMNQQRKVIYAERRRILDGENLAEQAHDMLVDVITAYVNGATSEGYAEDWDLEQLWTALKTLYPVGIDYHELLHAADVGEADDLTREELLEALIADAENAYAAREAEVDGKAGAGAMRELERGVLLSVLDRKWREHLYEMDYLKEGIGLRAMAQRDPLVEYQREGYDMFTGMLEGLKEESVGFLFNVAVEAAPTQPQVAPVDAPEGLAQFGLRAKGVDGANGADGADGTAGLTYSGPDEDGSAQVRRGRDLQPAGANNSTSRRSRREAARREGRGPRQPKTPRKG
ncbi:MAG: preprotein translocase subunit SecA, partial [Mycolicibacter algericus]